jgi:hypothetical protein
MDVSPEADERDIGEDPGELASNMVKSSGILKNALSECEWVAQTEGL